MHRVSISHGKPPPRAGAAARRGRARKLARRPPRGLAATQARLRERRPRAGRGPGPGPGCALRDGGRGWETARGKRAVRPGGRPPPHGARGTGSCPRRRPGPSEGVEENDPNAEPPPAGSPPGGKSRGGRRAGAPGTSGPGELAPPAPRPAGPGHRQGPGRGAPGACRGRARKAQSQGRVALPLVSRAAVQTPSVPPRPHWRLGQCRHPRGPGFDRSGGGVSLPPPSATRRALAVLRAPSGTELPAPRNRADTDSDHLSAAPVTAGGQNCGRVPTASTSAHTRRCRVHIKRKIHNWKRLSAPCSGGRRGSLAAEGACHRDAQPCAQNAHARRGHRSRAGPGPRHARRQPGRVETGGSGGGGEKGNWSAGGREGGEEAASSPGLVARPRRARPAPGAPCSLTPTSHPRSLQPRH